MLLVREVEKAVKSAMLEQVFQERQRLADLEEEEELRCRHEDIVKQRQQKRRGRRKKKEVPFVVALPDIKYPRGHEHGGGGGASHHPPGGGGAAEHFPKWLPIDLD